MNSELDIKDFFKAILKHWKLIVLITLGFLMGTFLITRFLIVPQYSASSQLYFENRTDTSSPITATQLAATQKLMSTGSVLFYGNDMMEKVIEALSLPYSPHELKEKVSILPMANTTILEITVTDNDPAHSALIANAFAEASVTAYNENINSGTVEIIAQATPSPSPDYPDLLTNMTISFFGGICLGLVLSFVLERKSL